MAPQPLNAPLLPADEAAHEVHAGKGGFSAIEKWILAALATIPLAGVLLLVDGLPFASGHFF